MGHTLTDGTAPGQTGHGLGMAHHYRTPSARNKVSLRAGGPPPSQVSLGIWLKPTNRFGLFGSCKLRFVEINSRLVFHINENRRIRCRFARFGFSVPPNQPRQTPEQINRENEERQNEQIEQGTVVR